MPDHLLHIDSSIKTDASVSRALTARAARVWATDISLQALEIARKNVTEYALDTRVRIVHGDLLDPICDSAPWGFFIRP